MVIGWSVEMLDASPRVFLEEFTAGSGVLGKHATLIVP